MQVCAAVHGGGLKSQLCIHDSELHLPPVGGAPSVAESTSYIGITLTLTLSYKNWAHIFNQHKKLLYH